VRGLTAAALCEWNRNEQGVHVECALILALGQRAHTSSLECACRDELAGIAAGVPLTGMP